MYWILGLIALLNLPAQHSSARLDDKGKAFSLFSVVTFKNEECTTTMDPTMNGICQSTSDCTDTGGTASGNCASGFGVCCFHKVDDDCTGNQQAVNNNVTYIQSPNFPTALTGVGSAVTCTYTITGGSNICQIRLDFDTLVLDSPGADGAIAAIDRIAITAPGNTLPLLGGINTGQHVYLDTARATGTAATVVITTVGLVASRTWKIKVRTLECSSASLAPAGCAQYHTGAGGRIRSPNSATPQLQVNLDYRICVRQEKGYCEMDVSETSPGATAPDSFFVAEITVAVTAGAALVGTNQQSFVGSLCDQAFVMVHDARICGDFFGDTNGAKQAGVATDPTAPFTIDVFSVYDNVALAGQVFDLTYRLTPC
jgi:hypothetical protein